VDGVDLVRVAGYGAGGDEDGRDVRYYRVEAEHCGVLGIERGASLCVRCGFGC
jgi:hypothetical protein